MELPVVLAAMCGLRASEILGLQWGDIKTESGCIVIERAKVYINGVPQVKGTKVITAHALFRCINAFRKRLTDWMSRKANMNLSLL